MENCDHNHKHCHYHLNGIISQLIIFGYTYSNVLSAIKENGNCHNINNIIDILERYRNTQQYNIINNKHNNSNICSLNAPTITFLPTSKTKTLSDLKLNQKQFHITKPKKKFIIPTVPPPTLTAVTNSIPIFNDEKLDLNPENIQCKHCKKQHCKKHNVYIKKPKSRLCVSNFLKLYNSFNTNNINKQTIRNCLPTQELKHKFDRIKYDQKRIGEICVRLWTFPGELYKDINDALYTDNKNKIIKYLPIIRGINLVLVKPTNKQMITYRGSKMTDTQFERYKIGFIFRCPAIGATSTSKTKARSFKSKYMIKFIIPRNCWNAANISKYSQFPNEKEILLPSYTAFKVLNIDINRKQIMVQVLDNKIISTNVPSVFI
eukprot:497683_1